MGPENSAQYQVIKNTLQRNKVPTVVLPPEKFSKHIPHVKLSPGNNAVVDTTAGVLYADRALRAVQVQLPHRLAVGRPSTDGALDAEQSQWSLFSSGVAHYTNYGAGDFMYQGTGRKYDQIWGGGGVFLDLRSLESHVDETELDQLQVIVMEAFCSVSEFCNSL